VAGGCETVWFDQERLPYEAVGILTVIEVSVSESPVFMVTLDESCIDMLNVPVVAWVQNEMSVSVSGDVPAHDVHSGSLDAEMEPAEALPHVTASRVVTDDTAVVPAEPGSAV
jgi:hypothetical protein